MRFGAFACLCVCLCALMCVCVCVCVLVCVLVCVFSSFSIRMLQGCARFLHLRIRCVGVQARSNCTFTATSTSIDACCTRVCTHPLVAFDVFCNFDDLYMRHHHAQLYEMRLHESCSCLIIRGFGL